MNVKAFYKNLITKGPLKQAYVPFHNFISKNGSLQDFRTKELKFSSNYPVYMTIQPSYDGSVNVIINDDNNKPTLINSRFSVKEDQQFEVVDHIGNRDTNLYQEGQVQQDTSLYKQGRTIVSVDLSSIEQGGKLKCGTYHFYFKLTDNDDNETDFIAESGIVTCFIGDINNPSSIRMGMINEDSKKLVKLKLSNVDTSFDFVRVYYTRTTSDQTQKDVTTAHYIETKYPIFEDNVDIIITGFENVTDIPLEQINPKFQYCQKVKTQAQCQNMLFFGNIDKPHIDYEKFQKASLCFFPKSIQYSASIGNINYNYTDISGTKSNEYYNPKNIYYHLGYFPEEYYRFGIVYILNDYTLSDVFDVRGIDLSLRPEDFEFNLIDNIEYNDDGLMKNTICYENVKGVVKIDNKVIITSNGVYPIGINFTFDKNASNWKKFLQENTKGFFFVRQQRIPTFYAQGLVIGKTKKDFGNLPTLKGFRGYEIEGFLSRESVTISVLTDSGISQDLSRKNILKGSTIVINNDNIENKALVVPEACVREPLFNSLFTSDKFKLQEYSLLTLRKRNSNFSEDGVNNSITHDIYDSKLTMVNDGMALTTDGENYFSAKAGDSASPIQCVDVNLNFYSEGSQDNVGKINTVLTQSPSLVRGMFGTYVGMSTNKSDFGTLVNIRPSDFNPESKQYLTNQYTLRSNDQQPYYAISQRLESNIIEDINGIDCYRGDCYVSMFTHRMHRNFIDSELPLCDNIVDKLTWYNNYAVIQRSDPKNGYTANEICESFYRKWHSGKSKFPSEGGVEGEQICADINTFKEIVPNSDLIKDDITGDETWKQFGAIKINRADLNAVPLGTWVTFKVLSNVNLSLRDIDQSYSGEQAIFSRSRGFYPYYKMSKYSNNKLPESTVINGGANVTLSQRINMRVPDVPWFKNQFDTRIMYSDIAVTDAFRNGYRIFQGQNYRDYPKTYGALVCLKEFYGDLIAVMENGVLRIPVNERAVAAQGSGGNVYINTSNVLPENPYVISDTYGSIWQDSIIKTPNYIYGVDTTAKKIWRTNGKEMQVISDFKVQKFLNDRINLSNTDKKPIVGVKNVKTHYNAFKHDIIFTFYNKGSEWSLCFNELLDVFVTFYSWTPIFSENINNIFFTFALENYNDKKYIPYLWKHGQAGNYKLTDGIKPTVWYNTQHRFEYEFVVNKDTQVQKIFNNLKIIQNKTNPIEFEYEVVGETYDWYKYKDIIQYLNHLYPFSPDPATDKQNLEQAYKEVLGKSVADILQVHPDFPQGEFESTFIFKQLPFIRRIRKNTTDRWEANSTDVVLIYDDLLNEERIHTAQLGNDIKKVGRVKGNMEYLEDLWDIEIRPTNFRYAYLDKFGNIQYKILKQERIRDKYIKIRVKYSGKDLAVIQGLKTFYINSYA